MDSASPRLSRSRPSPQHGCRESSASLPRLERMGSDGKADRSVRGDSSLPPEEIVRDLQSALNEFTGIARSPGGEVDVPEAEVE